MRADAKRIEFDEREQLAEEDRGREGLREKEEEGKLLEFLFFFLFFALSCSRGKRL